MRPSKDYDHKYWSSRTKGTTAEAVSEFRIANWDRGKEQEVLLEINADTFEYWEVDHNHTRLSSKPLPILFQLQEQKNEVVFVYAKVSHQAAADFRQKYAPRNSKTGKINRKRQALLNDPEPVEEDSTTSESASSPETFQSSRRKSRRDGDEEEEESEEADEDEDEDEQDEDDMVVDQADTPLGSNSGAATPNTIRREIFGGDSPLSPIPDSDDARSAMSVSPEKPAAPLPPVVDSLLPYAPSPSDPSTSKSTSSAPTSVKLTLTNRQASKRAPSPSYSEEEDYESDFDDASPPVKRKADHDQGDVYEPESVKPATKKARPSNDSDAPDKKKVVKMEVGSSKSAVAVASKDKGKGKEVRKEKSDPTMSEPPKVKKPRENVQIKSSARPTDKVPAWSASVPAASSSTGPLHKVKSKEDIDRPSGSSLTTSSLKKVAAKLTEDRAAEGTVKPSTATIKLKVTSASGTSTPKPTHASSSKTKWTDDDGGSSAAPSPAPSADETPARSSSSKSKLASSSSTVDKSQPTTKKSKLSTTVSDATETVARDSSRPSTSTISKQKDSASSTPADKKSLKPSTSTSTTTAPDPAPSKSKLDPRPEAAAGSSSAAASPSLTKVGSSSKPTPSAAAASTSKSAATSSKPSTTATPVFNKAAKVGLQKKSTLASGTSTPSTGVKQKAATGGGMDILDQFLGPKAGGEKTKASSASSIQVQKTEKELAALQKMREEHEAEMAAFKSLPGMQKPLDIESQGAIMRARQRAWERTAKLPVPPGMMPISFPLPHEYASSLGRMMAASFGPRPTFPKDGPTRLSRGQMPYPRSKEESESFDTIWVEEMEGKWDDPEAVEAYLANPKYSNDYPPKGTADEASAPAPSDS